MSLMVIIEFYNSYLKICFYLAPIKDKKGDRKHCVAIAPCPYGAHNRPMFQFPLYGKDYRRRQKTENEIILIR